MHSGKPVGESGRQQSAVIDGSADSIGSGQPVTFDTSLQLISNVIGHSLNTLCLDAYPMTCRADADCLPDQTCSLVVDDPSNPERSYRLCSGFQVRVQVKREDEVITLSPGMDVNNDGLEDSGDARHDFLISYKSWDECDGYPLKIRFNQVPSGDISIAYPVVLSKDSAP